MVLFVLAGSVDCVMKAGMVPMQRNVKAALGQSETAPLLLPDSAAKLAALPANVVQALHVSCGTAAFILAASQPVMSRQSCLHSLLSINNPDI